VPRFPFDSGSPTEPTRTLPILDSAGTLEDAVRLVHLYGEKESPKYERAALRWLERYLTESSPSLRDFADVTASPARYEGASASGPVAHRVNTRDTVNLAGSRA
jgi:hypothetical protein